MICYIAGTILAILALILFAILIFGSTKVSDSFGSFLLCGLGTMAMLFVGLLMIIENVDDNYSPGLTAAAKLEVGNYSSLAEAEGLIKQVNGANAFLKRAKENAHPAWNGRHMEKFQKFDFITVSEEAKQRLRDFIVSQFADARVASLTPPTPTPSPSS